MNRAGNSGFAQQYDGRLADLAELAEALRQLADMVTAMPGTIAARDLEGARADLRLAILTIAQAQEISGTVFIQLASMVDRLQRIAILLDRGPYTTRANTIGTHPVTDLPTARATYPAPGRLQ